MRDARLGRRNGYSKCAPIRDETRAKILSACSEIAILHKVGGLDRTGLFLCKNDVQKSAPRRRLDTRVPQVKVIRRALGMSQEESATRFHIPLGTLRDWEQGRKDPDTAARAYLRVIGRNPAAVIEALRPVP
jgi:putative transcriptional regulator